MHTEEMLYVEVVDQRDQIFEGSEYVMVGMSSKKAAVSTEM